MPLRALPVGEHGLLIELDRAGDAEALHAELLRRAADGTLPGVREIVPAARTVFLDGLADPGALAAQLPGWRVPPPAAGDRPPVEIPVRYDGPDLADVAALWGVTPEDVVRLHSGTAFRVAFCGFAPGFGYLTGLPVRLHVPRRATPRTRVPVGSVGLAGPYTGVYPRSSPGGWQLIGRTDAVLWDPRREPAALLAPGTPVRFVPVTAPVPAPRTGRAAEETTR
ncbi:allophanate hydrolase [Streptomyces sp. NRRL F-4489]|nr:allophanate hydrolase [Streptomyces sp. NRRL F-4489]